MECPKCGYMMDPFATECPRCARMGAPQATAAPADTDPSPIAAPREYRRPAGAVQGISIGLKQIITFVGSFFLLGGVFLPIISVPNAFAIGSQSAAHISLFQISYTLSRLSLPMMPDLQLSSRHFGALLAYFFLRTVAFILILLALGAVASVLFRWSPGLWISGLASLAILLFIVGYYFIGLAVLTSKMRTAMAAAGDANPFKDISLFGMAPLGWGAVAMMIGAIIITTAMVLREQ